MNNQFGSGEEAVVAVFALLFLAVCVVIGLAIAVTICLLLQSALKRVPAEHQKMSPGLVWLLLIPLFNMVWLFFVVINTSGSFKSYFDAQERSDVGDCGKGIGLAWAICAVASIIPMIGILIGLASLVLMIIYLVKATSLKNQIPIADQWSPPSDSDVTPPSPM